MMAKLPGGAFTFLAVSIVAFVILGSVLEGIPAIVLFGPLLFPIAKEIGVHEVPLRHGRDIGDGHRSVRAAVRRGLLRRLRHRPRAAGSRHARAIVGYLVSIAIGLVIVAAIPWPCPSAS